MTLNQVIQRIKALALSHRQINSFYFGDVPEFDANGDVEYPGCFLEQLPGSISRTERQQSFNFRIHLYDRVLVSEDTEANETDVLSDMHSVGADLLSLFMSPEYEYDWMVEPLIPVTPLTETLNDMVAGVYMDVAFKVDFLADSCQVPSTDVTFTNEFDMARTRILPYTGTGSEGDEFAVTGLAGKIVLAAYRATDYKRVITTVPVDTDKIKIEGTDLGDRKGILSTTGNVALVAGDALMNGEVLDFLIIE
jgi:hypothetical protein